MNSLTPATITLIFGMVVEVADVVYLTQLSKAYRNPIQWLLRHSQPVCAQCGMHSYQEMEGEGGIIFSPLVTEINMSIVAGVLGNWPEPV